jgi:hypothetical protein
MDRVEDILAEAMGANNTIQAHTRDTIVISLDSIPLDIFKPNENDFWCFNLIGTYYWYNAAKRIWFYDPRFHNGRDYSFSHPLPFENVLDDLPSNLKDKLLFHLDVFTGE